MILIGQSLPVSFSIFYENIRRIQLLDSNSNISSLMLRPIGVDLFNSDPVKASSDSVFFNLYHSSSNKFYLKPLALNYSVQLGGVPYPESSYFLQNKGLQNYLSTGFFARVGVLTIQVQPEFIYSQNIEYDVLISKSPNTEYLEIFGESKYYKFLPGQSSVRLNFGQFSTGFSTENIWWGPGQFNSLLFSNNAFGFNHLTLNTRKPVKTFLGRIEGQLLIGRLDGSGLESPISEFLIKDWRYLNGINVIYEPKWVKGFS
jgi:hypothetical protein